MHLSRPNARSIGEGKRIVKDLCTSEDLGITWSISEEDMESGFGMSYKWLRQFLIPGRPCKLRHV
jgi:hypothetical protein